MEDFLDFVESHSILRRIKGYVEHYVFRIQFVDFISQCCFIFGMTGIVCVGVLISIPKMYSNESSVFLASCVGYFLAFQIIVNWLSVKFVDSRYKPYQHGTKPDDIAIGQNFRQYRNADENQNGDIMTVKDVNICMDNTNFENGNTQSTIESDDQEKPKKPKYPYFSWKPCLECNRPKPPRSHHCPDCNKCVLKRDHHCYFAGNCVGYRNLRHFAMFVFYCFSACLFAGLHALPYYYYFVVPETRYVDLFVPLAALRALFGYIEWSNVFIISLGWSLLFFLIISRTYTFIVLDLIRKGHTSFEQVQKLGIIDTRPLSQKLRAVFGRYWALNFIVPLHFVFEPMEDPVTWPTIIAS
ncbi:Zinc finger DHHC-type containing 22 [Mactra antiquata]